MFLSYTTRAESLGTDGLMIRRLGSGAEGVPAIDIPKEVSVRAISVCPDKVSDVFPEYYVKGIHGDSSWARVDAGVGSFIMDGITDNVAFFMYVKASSGTINLNVFVKGQ